MTSASATCYVIVGIRLLSGIVDACRAVSVIPVNMVALWNRADHYTLCLEKSSHLLTVCNFVKS